MNNFKEKIRELRLQNNFFQKDIANFLNVEINTYGAWERGNSEPPIDIILKLSNFYKVSTDYILGNEEEDGRIIVQEIELPSDERQLINNYRELPEELKSSCIEYTKTMNNLNKEFINHNKNKIN